ncbi:septal ring lytic transglycosylase RlpA family protein [Hyphomicrobium sp.]|uniref:septal ring lytic transglycosylase RlpA family protein n=1 Tax=Hyphomicrobium sp. TaxID=82 RepID=UPI002FDD4959
MRDEMRRVFFLAAGAVLTAGTAAFSTPAAAKTPGKTYCYNKVCHRVKTLPEMEGLIGHEEVVVASYYDDCRVDKNNPCTALSSGEEHRPDLPDNAASPIYPNGTILVLVNPENEAQVLVRVNNSGPYRKGRMLDVSRAAAEQLGFIKKGVASLKVTVISGPLR